MESASYKAQWNSYETVLPDLEDENGDPVMVDFSPNGFYNTTDKEIQDHLAQHPGYGVRFKRIGGPDEAETWREQLEPYDRPEDWDADVLMAVKDGRDPLRCEYECGFATLHGGALSQHEKYCSDNPDNQHEEGS